MPFAGSKATQVLIARRSPVSMSVSAALAEVGEAEACLALLSNAGPDFAGWLRHGSFAPLFERVFISGELGMIKPGAEVYRHIMAELGIEPSEFLFVDNKAANVEGARAVGGDGHVFTDAAGLESWLRGLAA